MENKLFYVASNKLEIKKNLTKKKLFEQMPLIFREQGSATRNAMESFITKTTIQPVKNGVDFQ